MVRPHDADLTDSTAGVKHFGTGRLALRAGRAGLQAGACGVASEKQ